MSITANIIEYHLRQVEIQAMKDKSPELNCRVDKIRNLFGLSEEKSFTTKSSKVK